jgi:kynurenine 3-monooxygenase
MGDAAHAIVPFFGQGMNCGFEDCTLLDECIEQHGPDWERIFEVFGKLRKENVDAIADMALTNYIEMRDRVTDPAFLLQAQAGLLLEQRYPDLFIPKYSMVSFHRLPYAEALRRADIQESILQQLCASITSVEEIDWPSADRLIKERLIKD